MTDDFFPPFLFSFYESLPRQGPGDDNITRSILNSLQNLPDKPDIIDMGCGTGAQTLVLAERGIVTAVDFHEPFLNKLMKSAERKNCVSRIIPLVSSMDDLPSEIKPADLIWSEGAIYIIGFENGIRLWNKFVKPGGYIVVSECTQLVDDTPAEAAEFWNTEYPAMKTMKENCQIITETGYRCLRTIPLPHTAWTDYYAPQKEQITSLRSRTLSAEENAILGEIETEIDIQERYPNIYGYVFYVMQRPD